MLEYETKALTNTTIRLVLKSQALRCKTKGRTHTIRLVYRRVLQQNPKCKSKKTKAQTHTIRLVHRTGATTKSGMFE